MKKKISVIIPVRNEGKYVEKCLRSVVNNDYPQELLEVFVVDGMSDDGTREKTVPFLKEYPFIHLIDNPEKTVPFALNRGIRHAKGELIIRMDAHADYPENYFSALAEWQERTGADNVGGILITKPADSSPKARAVALATSSGFGVGNAQYRLKRIPDKPTEVDTVPFGCYRREIFDEIGMFEEELIRNQDDEFNARLKKHGGKIVLVPEIHINYYGRENWRKMFRMFYQYGVFKPLVNVKVGAPATLRQFVPPLFTLYLFFAPLLGFFTPMGLYGFIPFFIYAFLDLFVSLKISVREKSLTMFFLLPVTFFLIHFAYGLGYLAGIVRILLKKPVKEIKISR